MYPRKASSPSFALSKLVQKWSEMIWWGKTFRLNIYSLMMEEKELKRQLLLLHNSRKESGQWTKQQHNVSIIITQELFLGDSQQIDT